MIINTWHKPQDIWKYYYEECRNSFYTVIIKNKSYAIYNPQTKILYLQYFLRGITEPFKQRKQVQHTLKKHFGCTGTILVSDQQKETRKDTTFVKLEFYAICNLPTNEMMDKVGEMIDQSTAVGKI
jgi:hypothetical protein